MAVLVYVTVPVAICTVMVGLVWAIIRWRRTVPRAKATRQARPSASTTTDRPLPWWWCLSASGMGIPVLPPIAVLGIETWRQGSLKPGEATDGRPEGPSDGCTIRILVVTAQRRLCLLDCLSYPVVPGGAADRPGPGRPRVLVVRRPLTNRRRIDSVLRLWASRDSILQFRSCPPDHIVLTEATPCSAPISLDLTTEEPLTATLRHQ
jgi:hypothetical protein